MTLEKSDKKAVWHPFTQQSEWESGRFGPMTVIARGKGIYLYDDKGKKYIDGVSSLWANLHGHRNPAIDSAVKKQLSKIAHSTFLGLTHEPGIRLAESLIKSAPKDLSRVFYSDNGSTAVEVALKMAFQYHAQKHHETRPEFLTLREAYHGDTIGSVSVGSIALFHKKFGPLLFKTHAAMSPHCFGCPHNRKSKSERRWTRYAYKGESPKPGDARKETGCRWECLASVEKILKQKKKRIAAAIIEPIVQGAGGILVMPPGYLKGYERLARKHGVLLIADEVAVGFGRTGKLFASEHEGVAPDLLCLAKGISGGYLPLAATLTTEKIYRAFLGKHEEFKTFFHGHTFTANPLGCAAGIASMALLKEGTLARLPKLGSVLSEELKGLLSIPIVGNVRQAGMMAGVEIVGGGARAGYEICALAKKEGLLLRPLGDTLVLMPPLSIKENEVRLLVSKLKKAILSL